MDISVFFAQDDEGGAVSEDYEKVDRHKPKDGKLNLYREVVK